jgi:hypothetical protein
VILDQLPTGFTSSTQADFLTQWDIDELVNEGNAYWENMKHAPGLAAMKMRSRSSEAGILKGFKTFAVLEYEVEACQPRSTEVRQ